jgi:hypothetical protein
MTSIKSSSGTVEFCLGVPGEPETAVEHNAAKIIFEIVSYIALHLYVVVIYRLVNRFS